MDRDAGVQVFLVVRELNLMKILSGLLALAALSLFGLNACVVVEAEVGADTGSATKVPGSVPAYGQPLTVETGPGSVTIREGSKVLTSFRTAALNVEQTRWHVEQEEIVVKSRGNHGPATVELFNSRTGAKLGTVMAYDAASGPAWSRSMAE